ncbi:hypothetical protein EJ05DRAFT_200519 [Pseudovirgaria hyperparasitica]|uniref:Uncharacterized protein n=1 Tax=Pseudovirgaria hyperparasitica TaxID=470096 RepID=A0A6A6WJ69_9PEZI|nr:uncharacterized protein EJ05DRAFT_200519 [Pseudovirgaria hyperparasitica]KAF2762196.1 hypothetical protein EJ05DRAFT_200519 [Pseudovirgaria hyperparasitica]
MKSKLGQTSRIVVRQSMLSHTDKSRALRGSAASPTSPTIPTFASPPMRQRPHGPRVIPRAAHMQYWGRDPYVRRNRSRSGASALRPNNSQRSEPRSVSVYSQSTSASECKVPYVSSEEIFQTPTPSPNIVPGTAVFDFAPIAEEGSASKPFSIYIHSPSTKETADAVPRRTVSRIYASSLSIFNGRVFSRQDSVKSRGSYVRSAEYAEEEERRAERRGRRTVMCLPIRFVKWLSGILILLIIVGGIAVGIYYKHLSDQEKVAINKVDEPWIGSLS